MRNIIFISIQILMLQLPFLGHTQDQALPAEITPYGRTTPADVKRTMDQVHAYVDGVTPVGIINSSTGDRISDLTKPVRDAALVKTEYNITSHEWGLTYSAMIRAGEVTGDPRYTKYVSDRFEFLGRASEYFRGHKKAFPNEVTPLEHFLFPRSLDDTGSMCAAMIQGQRKGMVNALRPEIANSIRYIMTGVYRLSDGTFARNRPLPNSVWVDDLYQGIPALTEMGKLTGDRRYYNEAVRQVFRFSERLYDKQKGVFVHGWVEGMDPQPAFCWARANGWAIMAITVLLDALPEDHPQRIPVLELFKTYAHGLARLQSGSGFWHQLMDRNDSFVETSATAMFTYILAHGISEGWLDVRTYGPPAVLGWNAVSTQVNARGQVEGTSAGTSMAFDPAFYYQRPVGTGPHGYGSVLLAGAAVYRLLQEHPYEPGGPVIFRK